jgi:hypothetical protein
MSSTVLVELVGNDPIKAEELVTLFTGLVRSCLAAIHKEEEQKHDDIHESPTGTSKSEGDCVHSAIDTCSSSSPPGEHRTTVCTSGESPEFGVEQG